MFKLIEKAVSFLVEWVAMTLLVLMTLVVCYCVFTRYMLNYTPSWGEELALLSMVWFGFLAIALGVRDDAHIGVTMLDSIVSARTIHYMNYLKWLVIMGFGIFMFSEGLGMTKVGMRNSYPGLGIKSAWLYVVVPIAGGVIVVYCIQKLAGLVKKHLSPEGLAGKEAGNV